MLIIIIEYLKHTSIERVHERSVLCKNYSAYYRAIENMVNLSEKKIELISIFRENSIDFNKFEIIENELCLKNL